MINSGKFGRNIHWKISVFVVSNLSKANGNLGAHIEANFDNPTQWSFVPDSMWSSVGGRAYRNTRFDNGNRHSSELHFYPLADQNAARAPVSSAAYRHTDSANFFANHPHLHTDI